LNNDNINTDNNNNNNNNNNLKMNSFKSRSPFQPPSIPGYSRSKKSLGRMVD
jgi:hypothetical protein